MRDKNLRFFNLARQLSLKSTHHTHRLGCVLVRGTKVIGVGYNQLKSHPNSPDDWKTVHAEFHAVLGVSPADLHKARAYVYRESKSGDWALAKPCTSCQKLLRDCGVVEVLFTTSSGYDTLSLK
jgi:deoxycytidylate deaminase